MVYKRRLRKYQTGDHYGTYGSPLNASPYQNVNNLNTLSAPSTAPLMGQLPQANIQGVDPMRGITQNVQTGGGGYGGGVKGIFGSGAGAFGGQGAAVGALADAAGSIISADQEKGAASKAIEGAAKAVPLWGGVFNLTRSLTGKVAGDRTNTARSVVANMLSPSSGLTTDLDKRRNALVTTFNPILGGVMQAKEARKEEERRKLREYYNPEEQERSRNILADYNTSGTVYARGGKLRRYPAGGALPYPTDGSEVEQLSSNSAVYRGDTHANGGIELDVDQDQQPDIEVENNEVIKDNMVLSNRLSPSRHAKKFARTMGIVPKKRETYAKMAERIGKRKGQFEEGAESLSEAQRNTSRLMAERMDNAMDMLFMDQQQKKHTSDMKKMRYGGKYKSLTKMCALGGKFPGGGLYGPPDPPINKSVGVLAPPTPAEFNYLTPTTGGAVRRNQMAAQHLQSTARQSTRGPYLTDEDYNRFQTITGGKLHTPGAYRSANVHYLPSNYRQQADSTVNASRIFSRLEPQAGFADAMNYVKSRTSPELSALAGGLAYGGYTDGEDGVYAKGGPIKKRRRVNIGRRRFKAKYPGFPRALDSPHSETVYSLPSRQALWNNNAPKVLMYTGKGYKDWSGDVFDNTPSPITVYAAPQKDLSKYANRKPYAYGGVYPDGGVIDPPTDNIDLLMDKQAQDSIIKAYGQKMRAKKAAVRDSLVNLKAQRDYGRGVVGPEKPKISAPPVINKPYQPWFDTSRRSPQQNVQLFKEYQKAQRLIRSELSGFKGRKSLYGNGGRLPKYQGGDIWPPEEDLTQFIPTVPGPNFGYDIYNKEDYPDRPSMFPKGQLPVYPGVKEAGTLPTPSTQAVVAELVAKGKRAVDPYTRKKLWESDKDKMPGVGPIISTEGVKDINSVYGNRQPSAESLNAMREWSKGPSITKARGKQVVKPLTASQIAKRTPHGFMVNPRGFNIGDYRGDIAAGIGTIANQALISRLETNFNPETVEGPVNTYTDRTGQIINQANQQFRTASRGIAGSSAQDNAALKANMYAKTLDNVSQNLDRETLRRDELTNRFNELRNRTNVINTGIKNQGKLLSMENRNQKKALTAANIDNMVRSFMGNEAMRDLKKTEKGRIALIAAMSGDRGVFERQMRLLDPETRKSLGYDVTEYKKGGIYIKPANRGKFTAFANRKGMSVQGAARHVLANKGKYSSTIVKRANFARNAAKWKHEFGGTFDMGGTLPEYKKGGIYIKPKNRGKFNALKKRTGKTTAQLRHSKNPLTRKRAVFAANAKKWKH